MNAIERNQAQKRKINLGCLCHGLLSDFIECVDGVLVILVTDEPFCIVLIRDEFQSQMKS